MIRSPMGDRIVRAIIWRAVFTISLIACVGVGVAAGHVLRKTVSRPTSSPPELVAEVSIDDIPAFTVDGAPQGVDMLGAYLRKEERVLLAWAGCSLAYGDLERFSGIGSSGALPIIIVGTRDAPASEAVSDLRFMGLSVASVDDPNRELPFGLPAIVQVDGASGKITVHQGVDGIMIQAVAGREALGEPNTPSLESWPGRPSFQLYTN